MMEVVIAVAVLSVVVAFVGGYFAGLKVGTQDGIVYVPKIITYKFPKLPVTEKVEVTLNA